MKVYIELPHKENTVYQKHNWYIPLVMGIIIGFDKYKFNYPAEKYMIPRKHIIGNHLCTILIVIFYWRFNIVFYNKVD